MIKMNRTQYLEADDGTGAYRTYYSQFVTGEIKNRVLIRFGKERILRSTDKHFNDIPLYLWDYLSSPCPFEVGQLLKEAGDYPTLSGMVCILKEAAQQIREEG